MTACLVCSEASCLRRLILAEVPKPGGLKACSEILAYDAAEGVDISG